MLDSDKITYSIGHVSEIVHIAQSTIRYWETVIDVLEPIKTPGGSRRYTKAHIELIIKIKDLLHNQGLTIKGANHYFKKERAQGNEEGNIEKNNNAMLARDNVVETKHVNTVKINFQYIKNELEKIKKILE